MNPSSPSFPFDLTDDSINAEGEGETNQGEGETNGKENIYIIYVSA